MMTATTFVTTYFLMQLGAIWLANMFLDEVDRWHPAARAILTAIIIAVPVVIALSVAFVPLIEE